MLKANGRVSKTKDKETASSNKGKEFKCVSCDVLKKVGNIEFGEVIECPKCGSNMEEVI